MAPSEMLQFDVEAELWWNPTGLELLPGERYRISARGQWRDAGIRSGAAGYSNTWLTWAEGSRRLKDADWFSLIAAIHPSPSLACKKPVGHNFLSGWMDSRRQGVKAIDSQARLARIGAENTLDVVQAGYLYLFANDAPFAYCNNHGRVTVSVARLA